ncbi:MAG: indolepyruvate oxidoreductase subunit beta [Thermoplasmata archaeon]
MVSKNFDMLLAGVGGQGIILAGQIIMNAALRQDNTVYGFEEHGMARRGGAVATHIRFGEGIYTPLIPLGSGKLLAAFEPSEALRHLHFMSPEATIILNTRPVMPVSVFAGKSSYPDIKKIVDVIGKNCKEVHYFDATSLAKEAGNPIAMNVVMLGAICASDVAPLPKKVLEEVIISRSPSYSRDINMKAFEKGFEGFEDSG